MRLGNEPFKHNLLIVRIDRENPIFLVLILKYFFSDPIVESTKRAVTVTISEHRTPGTGLIPLICSLEFIKHSIHTIRGYSVQHRGVTVGYYQPVSIMYVTMPLNSGAEA